jgi:nicotinic acid phosphoribosyltransferase
MPSAPLRSRLAPEVFDLPVEKLRAGWYTDAYFNHTRATLLADGHRPRVVVQVFQKNDAWLGGVDEAIAILRLCADEPDQLTIRALRDGDRLEPWETVLTIEGDYTTFAHLETAYLGALARRTLITTNAVRVLEAANGKSLIFMPARFDHQRVQAGEATRRTSRDRSPVARSGSRATSRRPGGAAAHLARSRTRSSRPTGGTRSSPRAGSRTGLRRICR